MQIFIKYLISAFILLLFSTCSPLRVEKEFPGINEVPADSKFQIILPEDHTTGYMWQLKHDYDDLVIAPINEVWHGNEKGIYFNLKALASGQTTLTFVSRRYTDTSDVKRFIVKIAGE